MSIVLVILSFILCISYGSATGRLYTYYENSSPISWLRAADLCVEHGKSLATFITENDRINLMNAIGQKRAYIGLNDRGTENIWTWIDGTQCESGHGNLCIAEWKIGEPNGSGDCSEMTGGLVDDLNCDADYFWIDGYVCNDPTPSPTRKPTSNPTLSPTKQPTKQPTPSPTKQPTSNPTPPPPTADPTRNPTMDPTNRPTQNPTPTPPRLYTYFKSSSPISWLNAADLCMQHGSSLATFITDNDHTNLMNAIGQNRAYIGLNDRGTENIWTWTDGTQCEPGHGTLCIGEWKIGEPNGSGDCSEMTGGLVDDLNCDAAYFWINGYVCNGVLPSGQGAQPGRFWERKVDFGQDLYPNYYNYKLIIFVIICMVLCICNVWLCRINWKRRSGNKYRIVSLNDYTTDDMEV